MWGCSSCGFPSPSHLSSPLFLPQLCLRLLRGAADAAAGRRQQPARLRGGFPRLPADEEAGLLGEATPRGFPGTFCQQENGSPSTPNPAPVSVLPRWVQEEAFSFLTLLFFCFFFMPPGICGPLLRRERRLMLSRDHAGCPAALPAGGFLSPPSSCASQAGSAPAVLRDLAASGLAIISEPSRDGPGSFLIKPARVF